MGFLSEAEPQRGTSLNLLPGISRVVARNPSVMTYWGTNTYLIEGADGLTILDPGPDDETHVADILRAAGDKPIARLLLTHTHSDHLGATAKLQAATNVPVYAFHISPKADFAPDIGVRDGDELAGLKALHTPGHAADHLSFIYNVPGTGEILFSGDHVMSWSSSIVSPPDGDMVAYYQSLQLLLERREVLYLSGHGPILEEPRKLVLELLSHRQKREATILRALEDREFSVAELAEHLYAKTDYRLKIAAQRNVLAHLLKLAHEGRVIQLEESADEAASMAFVNDDLPPASAQAVNPALVAMFMRDGARRFAVAA